MQFLMGFSLGLIFVPYVLFLRGLWRGGIGYPPDNFIERLLS